MERWVSASQLKTALVCPASLILPRSNKAYSENASKAADFGTKGHTYIETGEILPGMEAWAAKGDRNKLYPAKGHHEVVGWYDPISKECGLKFPPADPKLRRHRDYAGIPEHCIVGTIDYHTELKSGKWWIDDLKTGAKLFLPEPDSEQMYFGAMVLNTVKRQPVISTITWWPQYPLDQLPDRQKVEFQDKHLLVFRDKLDKMYDLYVKKVNTQKRNSGCLFCKSAGSCETGRKVKEEVAERKRQRAELKRR